MTDDRDQRGRQFSPNAVHLVRTAQQIGVQLSQMADQKASMLMGATFVVFTLAVGQARSGAMLLPIAILAASALLSAVLAVLAALPKISGSRTPMAEDANLLFFGNYTTLGEAEFIDLTLDRLAADEAIYRTMLRDIYQNGTVLQRKKYRYLGWAYRVFLAGLGLTFTAFLMELVTGRYI